MFTFRRESIGASILPVGCIFLIMGLGFAIKSIGFLPRAEPAQGKVVRFVEYKGSDDLTMYCPVFAFRDGRGVEHVVKAEESCSVPQYKVGDQIRVLYATDSPEEATIDTFGSVWGVAVISSCGGLFAMTVGLVIMFWHRITGLFRRHNQRPRV